MKPAVQYWPASRGWVDGGSHDGLNAAVGITEKLE